MDAYIKPSTMEYPRFIGDIHLEFPDWTDDQPLPEGWARVHYEQPPTIDEYFAADVLPAEIQADGTWLVIWGEPRPMTAQERAAHDAMTDHLHNAVGCCLGSRQELIRHRQRFIVLAAHPGMSP